MDLAELIEAHLAGQQADVPGALRAEFDHAIAAHAAIRDALDETILVDGRTDSPDRPPPQLPDDYEIVRELGRGGMGVVYLARQKSLGRLVAVKVLRPGEHMFGPIVQRFEEEARHLARLRHPNIVAVHEVGRAEGEPYFTMDYIEGEPLTGRLVRAPLTPSQALAILEPAADAVRHAHQQGVIHRDLKPGNILLDGTGRAYVTDFGLARDMGRTSSLTGPGQVMGTPAYMAPEQALGQVDRIGEATDVHALGAILYEMLTGRPPYGQDAPARVLARLLDEEPVPLRRIDRRIPRDLETICLKAMAKEPVQRYATVGALLEDVRRFEAGEPPLAQRPGLLYRSWRWVRRHGRGIAASVLVAAGTIGVWSLVVPPRVHVQVRDRTIASLVNEADAHHDTGDHALAVRLYTTAARQAKGDSRRTILGKISRCVEDLDDPKTAVEVALPVIELDRHVSFGRYDPILARAVDGRTRGVSLNHRHDQSPGNFIAELRPEDREKMELAEARLELVANGDFPIADRQEAGRLLERARALLRGEEPQHKSFVMPKEVTLPKGTAEELHRRSLDTLLSPWDRGKAAYAEGRACEAAHDPDAALDAYQRAFDLIRSVFPFYAGTDPAAPQQSKPRLPLDLDPERRLLADIDAAIHRLDPNAPEMMHGGLRFHVEGLEFPPEVAVSFSPRLIAPSVDARFAEIPSSIWIGSVNADRLSLKGGQPAWVGVADGRYRLTIPAPGKSFSYSGPPDETTRRFHSLLEVDYSGLPVEVEVRGATIDLPPLRARLLEEIRLLGPPDRAPFDPNEGFFRWTPVPGVTKYVLQIAIVASNEEGGTTHKSFGDYQTEATTVCLGVAPDQYRVFSNLSREFRAGSIGEWTVVAVDAAGRRLGAVVGADRTFLVARGLERPTQ
jgi:predicted Ser/Thr protein kinase